ncbi:MAG: tyrosine--tRNA ligase [bacterium]|nr:tyrosine--tRNA ligase [bacterium]
MTGAEQFDVLRRNAVEVYTEAELRERLATGRPLRVKLGVDPTAPDIHLGHTVALQKLRQFQDLGHQAVLIIGDFTARIGDPSGRSATRPQLTPEQIEANATTYLDQLFKVLRREQTEVRRNSEWLGAMGLDDVVRLASRMTVARMLERDDFHRRHRTGSPIGLHEFLYPLLQGWDSVAVGADVEIGGTDQTFNLLVGRDLQRAHDQAQQIAIVLPLLEGLDGQQKMSKSLSNHVGIAEPPEEMYGKLMSISDPLMLRYYDVLSAVAPDRLAAVHAGTVHPLEAKKALAAEIVSRFHGDIAATRAAEFFRGRFQNREANEPEVHELPAGSPDVWIAQLIKDVGFVASTSEARRLVAQGGVRVDGNPVNLDFRFRPGSHKLVAVGRRRLAEIRLRSAE